MRRSFLSVVALFSFLAASPACWAHGDESPFAFDVSPRIWGLDLGIGYRGLALLPGVDTTFWVYAGGGYETMYYYRTAAGGLVQPGDLAATGALAGQVPAYKRIEAAWKLGFVQGFAWNERTGTNLVEAFAWYRGRSDWNNFMAHQLISASTISDQDGILQNSLVAGAAYNDVLFAREHKTKSGISGEVSAEWGPGFLLNSLVGSSDYLRLNATFRGFLPVYDVAPDRPVNLFSVYLGEFLSVDYAVGIGAAVPLNIRQTFGGTDPRTGLGWAVRGVDTGSLDTNLKAVNNLEVRMNLPAIVLPDLVPGVVVYWDVGYFVQAGEAGVADPAPSGLVSSAGAGVYIDLMDIATLAFYAHYRLTGANADGTALTPFALEFGLHF